MSAAMNRAFPLLLQTKDAEGETPLEAAAGVGKLQQTLKQVADGSIDVDDVL